MGGIKTYYMMTHGIASTVNVESYFGLDTNPVFAGDEEFEEAYGEIDDMIDLGTELVIPRNMMVVMNCYNRKGFVDVHEASYTWYLATHAKLHESVADVTSAKPKDIDNYINHLTLLGALKENDFCVFMDKCPNIFFSPTEQNFRTGFYPLPVKVSAKDGETGRYTMEDIANIVYYDPSCKLPQAKSGGKRVKKTKVRLSKRKAVKRIKKIKQVKPQKKQLFGGGVTINEVQQQIAHPWSSSYGNASTKPYDDMFPQKPSLNNVSKSSKAQPDSKTASYTDSQPYLQQQDNDLVSYIEFMKQHQEFINLDGPQDINIEGAFYKQEDFDYQRALFVDYFNKVLHAKAKGDNMAIMQGGKSVIVPINITEPVVHQPTIYQFVGDITPQELKSFASTYNSFSDGTRPTTDPDDFLNEDYVKHLSIRSFLQPALNKNIYKQSEIDELFAGQGSYATDISQFLRNNNLTDSRTHYMIECLNKGSNKLMYDFTNEETKEGDRRVFEDCIIKEGGKDANDSFKNGVMKAVSAKKLTKYMGVDATKQYATGDFEYFRTSLANILKSITSQPGFKNDFHVVIVKCCREHGEKTEIEIENQSRLEFKQKDKMKFIRKVLKETGLQQPTDLGNAELNRRTGNNRQDDPTFFKTIKYFYQTKVDIKTRINQVFGKIKGGATRKIKKTRK